MQDRLTQSRPVPGTHTGPFPSVHRKRRWRRHALVGVVAISMLALAACGGGGGGGGAGASAGVARYGFVVNQTNNSVSSYVVDAATGRLKWIGKAATDKYPVVVAVDPSGKYAYVTNYQSTDVSQYTIGSDGRLTAMNPATVTAGAQPQSVTVDPSGKYVYVTNAYNGTGGNSVSQYTIGTGGGLKALIPSGAKTNTVATGAKPRSITLDPSGKYAYVANGAAGTVSMYTIGTDGSLAPLKPGGASTNTVPAGTSPHSIAIDPSGSYAYVTDDVASGTVLQYTIGSDGSLTAMKSATVGAGSDPFGITVGPSGRYVYVANYNGNDVSAYAIGSGGALTQIKCGGGSTCESGDANNFAAGTGPQFVAVDPAGKYVFAVNYNGASNGSVSQYTIGSNGGLTPVNPGSAPAYGGPTSLALLGGSTAVKAVPKYAYVANLTTGVSAYTIAVDGSLTRINCQTATGGTGCDSTDTANFAGVTKPYSIAVDPTGKYAYAANEGSNDVSAYTIGSGGVLAQINCKTATGGTGCETGDTANFAAGTQAFSVTVDPTGKYAYVANLGSTDVSAYTIGSGGVLTQINCKAVTGGTGCNGTDTANFASGSYPESVTVDPSGRYVYVANFYNGTGGNSVSQYTIGSNGALIPMATAKVSAGTSPASIVVDPSGRYAYVANNGSNDVSAYTIGSGGALAQINCNAVTGGTGCASGDTANFAAGSLPESVTVDPSGHYAYVSNDNGGSGTNVSQYVIAADGSLTPMSSPTATTGYGPRSVTVDPSGKYAYVANDSGNDVSAYTLGSGGALTQINCTTVTGGTGCASLDTAGFAAGTNPESITATGSWK